MKHTKGPWINRTMGDETDRNGGQIFSGKLHLATTHYGNGIDVEERTANAALIAAAPEMYEALKGIIAALSQNKTYPADIDAAKSFARAALAKAKGGENGNNN